MLDLEFSGRFQQTHSDKAFAYHFELSLAHTGITAVYGHSGEGKTTFLRLVSGLQKTDIGRICFQNTHWQDDKHFVRAEKRKIAYVFQESRLFKALTVEQNVLYGLGGKWRKLNTKTKALVEEVCQQVGINTWLKRYPEQLSGGQKQRVALARSLVCRPRLLLLDEPFSSLGEQGKLDLLRYVARFTQTHKIPCLFVSHSRFEIESLASHAIFIQQGKVIAQGEVSELLTRLDLGLSHEEQSTALLKAKVLAHEHAFSLSKLSLGQQVVWVQQVDATVGQTVALRVFAKDVIISIVEPVESSVLNHLEGCVTEVEQSQESRVLLVVVIDQQKVLARITRKSLVTLGIKTGQKVYIQFKSVGLGAISLTP